MAQVKVDIDQTAVNRMLGASAGPVGKDLQRRSRNVARRARQLAPGTMKKKISTSVESGHVRVECSHPATLFVVKRTQPHAIRPRPPRKMLRFVSHGRIVFTRFVWHPGNRHPNNFLAKALREAGK